MHNDLAAGQILDLGAAGTIVSDLLMLERIILRQDVQGLHPADFPTVINRLAHKCA